MLFFIKTRLRQRRGAARPPDCTRALETPALVSGVESALERDSNIASLAGLDHFRVEVCEPVLYRAHVGRFVTKACLAVSMDTPKHLQVRATKVLLDDCFFAHH